MKEGTTWVRVTYAGDIPVREGRAVQVGSREIAIFNQGDRFLAIENRCPHKGGPLAEGIVSGAAVVCPLHAWKFSLESGKGLSAASDLRCVQTFPARVERGIVWVEINIDSVEDETTLAGLSAICVEQGSASCPEGSTTAAN